MGTLAYRAVSTDPLASKLPLAPSSLVRSGSINKMKSFSIGVERRLEPALSTPRYLREDRCDCLHGTSPRSACYADVVLVADDFHECDV
jgi:hypothetical protein